jgi:hypothetical protein
MLYIAGFVLNWFVMCRWIIPGDLDGTDIIALIMFSFVWPVALPIFTLGILGSKFPQANLMNVLNKINHWCKR